MTAWSTSAAANADPGKCASYSLLRSASCGFQAANAVNVPRPVTASWATAVAWSRSDWSGGVFGGTSIVPPSHGNAVDPPPSHRLTALARVSFGSMTRATARRKSVSRRSFSATCWFVMSSYGRWR